MTMSPAAAIQASAEATSRQTAVKASRRAIARSPSRKAASLTRQSSTLLPQQVQTAMRVSSAHRPGGTRSQHRRAQRGADAGAGGPPGGRRRTRGVRARARRARVAHAIALLAPALLQREGKGTPAADARGGDRDPRQPGRRPALAAGGARLHGAALSRRLRQRPRAHRCPGGRPRGPARRERLRVRPGHLLRPGRLQPRERGRARADRPRADPHHPAAQRGAAGRRGKARDRQGGGAGGLGDRAGAGAAPGLRHRAQLLRRQGQRPAGLSHADHRARQEPDQRRGGRRVAGQRLPRHRRVHSRRDRS